MDYRDLSNGFDQLVRVFERPKYQVDMLHGKMKQQDKDAVMERFKTGITHILVSTTVIEVGVNVPNASVMVIESAEKFGLAQLHQLRGRVGRGSEQSYCILMSGHKLSKQARERLGAMVRTNNGFEIAEMDMKLRGPGDMEGTRQSGLNELRLSSIVQDAAILEESRYAAQKILEVDPELAAPEHLNLRKYIEKLKGAKDWSRVS
jgi:ATP-dependent DNA helicase RecG